MLMHALYSFIFFNCEQIYLYSNILFSFNVGLKNWMYLWTSICCIYDVLDDYVSLNMIAAGLSSLENRTCTDHIHIVISTISLPNWCLIGKIGISYTWICFSIPNPGWNFGSWSIIYFLHFFLLINFLFILSKSI